jgi:hypothetical protein
MNNNKNQIQPIVKNKEIPAVNNNIKNNEDIKNVKKPEKNEKIDEIYKKINDFENKHLRKKSNNKENNKDIININKNKKIISNIKDNKQIKEIEDEETVICHTLINKEQNINNNKVDSPFNELIDYGVLRGTNEFIGNDLNATEFLKDVLIFIFIF